ncbi:DUF7504 family protein [Halorientalis pallida]|uniref:RecA-superfamily ATPase, KaiC/GvpD/RAD55 family n=1 Tax=Halorientalis pallida TaxID=2479928 RepID=A0A498L0B0_9EURY|nr:hypothetical protein [Halorientalis pallida]RXK50273.1 hypothetical protein EAF64_06845 [Halorientalis pallida]
MSDGTETPLDPGALPTGESVLIAGPAMTGKRRLLFDLVGASPDGAALLVTTKRGADRFRENFLTGRDADDWTLRSVDCVSRSRGFTQHRDSDTVKYVTSAGDLTGVGIAASGFLREFYHADREARVGLHSLSTMLMYADLRRVYQFAHVLTGRIESSGFAGAFTLDTTARNTESLDVLTQVFDALVEVREEGSGPELKVRGGDFGPRTWTAF